MQDDDNPGRELAPHEEDDRDQAGIMALVIAEHPTQLTVSELIRQMVPREAASIESDRVERGVRDLVGGSGCCIAVVTPSARLARRFNHLFFDRD